MSEVSLSDQARRGRDIGPFTASLALIVCSLCLCLVMVFSGRSVVFGSANYRFVDEGGVLAALARRSVEAKAMPTISDDDLRQIAARMTTRAQEGDPQAALFLFEVARLQRRQDGGATPAR